MLVKAMTRRTEIWLAVGLKDWKIVDTLTLLIVESDDPSTVFLIDIFAKFDLINPFTADKISIVRQVRNVHPFPTAHHILKKMNFFTSDAALATCAQILAKFASTSLRSQDFGRGGEYHENWDTISNYQLDNILHKSRKQNHSVWLNLRQCGKSAMRLAKLAPDLFVHKNFLFLVSCYTVIDGDILERTGWKLLLLHFFALVVIELFPLSFNLKE